MFILAPAQVKRRNFVYFLPGADTTLTYACLRACFNAVASTTVIVIITDSTIVRDLHNYESVLSVTTNHGKCRIRTNRAFTQEKKISTCKNKTAATTTTRNVFRA